MQPVADDQMGRILWKTLSSRRWQRDRSNSATYTALAVESRRPRHSFQKVNGASTSAYPKFHRHRSLERIARNFALG
jgi:hypothetical protein